MTTISNSNLELIIFIILSIFIIFFSSHVILKPKSHGFFRFLGWEGIAWLLANNYKYWFVNPFSLLQIISWICLLYGAYLVLAGVILMKTKGKSNKDRNDNTLYSFEKTTQLIDTGLFKYVRHPLYGSLVFLTWGIFFKNFDWLLLIISVLSTFFFFITMIVEEKENIMFFGEEYQAYTKRSKMIIPFII